MTTYSQAKTGEARSAEPRLVKGTLNQSNDEKNETFLNRQRDVISSLSQVNNYFTDQRQAGNSFYVNAKSFNTGDVELVALKLGTDDALKSGGGSARHNTDKKEMTPEVLKKSQLRAKKLIRHKLLMMQSDRMLTLTYQENITDIKQAWHDLKEFNRLMKWRYKDWAYVAVPEYQKRGAVHFHLAIKGYYHANTVRLLWHKAIGGNKGNIDITSPRVIDKKSWNPKRIANYLAKYVTKSETVDFNQKRYSSSRIDLPPSISGWISLGIPPFRFMLKLLQEITNKPYQDYWEADGYLPISMMST